MNTTEVENNQEICFLGDSSGFVASTYTIIFKLQEKQIRDFGKLCPNILSKSFIFF